MWLKRWHFNIHRSTNMKKINPDKEGTKTFDWKFLCSQEKEKRHKSLWRSRLLWSIFMCYIFDRNTRLNLYVQVFEHNWKLSHVRHSSTHMHSWHLTKYDQHPQSNAWLALHICANQHITFFMVLVDIMHVHDWHTSHQVYHWHALCMIGHLVKPGHFNPNRQT